MREMNFAREHPDLYADYLEKWHRNFRGNAFVLSSGRFVRTREGVSALEEAIRFLRQVRPLPPLSGSAGMTKDAVEHVVDQADGSLGHGGSDRSSPALRLRRHGSWSGQWGENISYGKTTAREIVAALIIDDGQRARKHRRNIFNAAFNFAGAAVGRHARFGTVCSMEFAGGYAERGRFDDSPRYVRN